jgi:SPX domain protein involved in polyphosphate accumulation
MKFGHDLHRHVVPQWSQYYADYNLLKRLAKSYDSQGELREESLPLDLVLRLKQKSIRH